MEKSVYLYLCVYKTKDLKFSSSNLYYYFRVKQRDLLHSFSKL